MKYLIPEFTGIGDMIQKTPMIRAIREHDQDASIFVFGDNRWKGLDIIKDSPLIEGTFNVFEISGITFPKIYTNTDIANLYQDLTHQQRQLLSEWLRCIEWDVYFDSYHSDVPPVISRLV